MEPHNFNLSTEFRNVREHFKKSTKQEGMSNKKNKSKLGYLSTKKNKI